MMVEIRLKQILLIIGYLITDSINIHAKMDFILFTHS